MAGEVQDPNLADLPPEAFEEPGPNGLTESQLEFRIRMKREAAAQESGLMQSPHHDAEIEPIDEATREDVERTPVEEGVAAEEEAVAEPVTEEGEEQDDALEEEGEEEDFYVGRYKSREAAEEAIAEKDRTIARLFREKHEATTSEQQQEGQPQVDFEAWQEWAENEVGEGRASVDGAMVALERGGEVGYSIYMSNWLDDPNPASRAQARMVEMAVTRQQATLAAQATQPVQQPVDDAETAMKAVADRYPDFETLRPEMDRLVTSPDGLDDPTKNWLTSLAQSGPEGKERAWEYLYLQANTSTAPQRAKAQQEERKQRRASSDAAKLAATVSSNEGTPTRTPLSEAELAVIRKKNAIRSKLGQELLPEE